MIFIPVCNPNNELLKLLISLTKNYQIKASNIVIINDHSDQKKTYIIFNNIKKLGCQIIHNNFEKGKGASIKFSINYAKQNKIKSLIFADGDGQHTPKDISNIYKLSRDNKDNFIIGERDFKDAPILNKLSNIFSNYLFNNITNLNLHDTQCGLRYINNKHFNILLKIKENKFDFELISLFQLFRNGCTIQKIKIKTVYFENKYTSHFNKLFDTLSILKVFLKFKLFK